MATVTLPMRPQAPPTTAPTFDSDTKWRCSDFPAQQSREKPPGFRGRHKGFQPERLDRGLRNLEDGAITKEHVVPWRSIQVLDFWRRRSENGPWCPEGAQRRTDGRACDRERESSGQLSTGSANPSSRNGFLPGTVARHRSLLPARTIIVPRSTSATDRESKIHRVITGHLQAAYSDFDCSPVCRR